MATTLNIESFNETNLRARTTLSAGLGVGATVITVVDAHDFSDGDTIYVGNLGRDGCEKAVIASITGETTINLSSPLTLAHAIFEPVTSVLGDLIHVYRAANIDGTVPSDESFTVLATRSIDAEKLATYYTDSSGSSDFWYRSTYYNATSLDETDLGDSVPVRGDDFGHYASLNEIRVEAKFENAVNLKDSAVDQQRRAAESEINTSLAGTFKTPFSPVPDQIHTLTIQLAAGLLMDYAYNGASAAATNKIKAARASITMLQSQASTINDASGNSLSTSTITSYPDDTVPTQFVIGDRF